MANPPIDSAAMHTQDARTRMYDVRNALARLSDEERRIVLSGLSIERHLERYERALRVAIAHA